MTNPIKAVKDWLQKQAERAVIKAVIGRLREVVGRSGFMVGMRSQIVGAIIAALGGVKVWAVANAPELVQWIDVSITILTGIFGVTLAQKVDRNAKG